MSEHWRDVIGYEGLYEVSDNGAIRSVDRRVEFSGRWGKSKTHFPAVTLAAYISKNGYQYASLSRMGKKKTLLVHRLVMAAFDSPSEKQVNHLDGNKANNRRENLEYCTASENLLHASRVLGTRRGSAMSSKLTEDDIPKIRLDTRILREIAEDYGVTLQAIHLVKSKKNWWWIP